MWKLYKDETPIEGELVLAYFPDEERYALVVYWNDSWFCEHNGNTSWCDDPDPDDKWMYIPD